MRINLPNEWRPRTYQRPLWDYLSRGGRRAVAVWHRRAGKDDVMLHHTACAAHERVGNYWYMLPEFNQCRKAVWDAINPHRNKKRLDIAFPMELREATLQQEMMIRLKNGSTFQLIGSDNFDSLVGSTPIGVVFSEYALTNPAAWAYISPILLENNGWAIFNGTPRGQNHLQAILKTAMDNPDWFGQVLTNDDTGVFTKEQLDDVLKQLQDEHGEAVGDALFMQEYFCSFNAAVIGSYYAKELATLRRQGRFTEVGIEEDLPVHTAWDLGYTDDTAIWFYQTIFGEVHIVDYLYASGEDIPYYIRQLRKKGYRYGKHHLPHDARAKTLGSGGKSIVEQMASSLGLGNLRVVPKLSLQDGIQAVRMVLKRCWFDQVKTLDGVKALAEYQREYDTKARALKSQPKHDWTSHAADAFRMLAIGWAEDANVPLVEEEKQGFIEVSTPSLTFDDLMKKVKSVKKVKGRI